VTDTSNSIDTETRDRLARLAEEPGVTVKALVREWAFRLLAQGCVKIAERAGS
jgi:hypothetical protein